MPALTPHTEKIRKLQALEATKLIASGTKKTSACEQVGLTVRQYDYWFARDDGAIEGLQKAIVESERIRLAEIANATAIVLRELIAQVTQVGTDPLIQLKALIYLDKLQKELQEKHGVNTDSDEADAYLLKGPTLRVEESKLVTSLQ